MPDEIPEKPNQAPSPVEISAMLRMPDQDFRLQVYSDVHKINNHLQTQASAMHLIAQSTGALRDAVTGGEMTPQNGIRYRMEQVQESIRNLQQANDGLATALRESNRAFADAIKESNDKFSRAFEKVEGRFIKAQTWALGLLLTEGAAVVGAFVIWKLTR